MSPIDLEGPRARHWARLKPAQLRWLARQLALDLARPVEAWALMILIEAGLDVARIEILDDAAWPLPLAQIVDVPEGEAPLGEPVIAFHVIEGAATTETLFILPSMEGEAIRNEDGLAVPAMACARQAFGPALRLGDEPLAADANGVLTLAATGHGFLRAWGRAIADFADAVMGALGVSPVPMGAEPGDVARALIRAGAYPMIPPSPTLITDWRRVDWRPERGGWLSLIARVVLVDDVARARWLHAEMRRPRRLDYPAICVLEPTSELAA